MYFGYLPMSFTIHSALVLSLYRKTTHNTPVGTNGKVYTALYKALHLVIGAEEMGRGQTPIASGVIKSACTVTRSRETIHMYRTFFPRRRCIDVDPQRDGELTASMISSSSTVKVGFLTTFRLTEVLEESHSRLGGNNDVSGLFTSACDTCVSLR